MISQNPWEFNGNCVLVLSDVHQRLNWLEAVLDKEKGNFDKFVFAGDMFDTHYLESDVSGIRETAKRYASLINDPNNLILAGNHDLPYIECWSDSKSFSHKKHIINECSGFSKNKSIQIAKELSAKHIEKIRLFSLVNGWLVSHAGVCKQIWDFANKARRENECVLASLYRESVYAMTHISVHPSVLLAAGVARGGAYPYGGLTWSDWEIEFEDDIPFPQIVGHTYYPRPRQIGRSFCIDTGITYAMIYADGHVEIKNLSAAKNKDNNNNLIWINTDLVIKKMR